MKKITISVLTILILGAFQTWSFDYPSFGAHMLDFPFGYDTLRNTSRLTDAELRYGFEHFLEWKMAGMLDSDEDGFADFTGIEVCEFLERMKIILSDREPFIYVFSSDWARLEEEWPHPSRVSDLSDI